MKRQNFSRDFQESIVRKYLVRGNRPISSLAQDAGISVGAIYSWVKKYANVSSMNNKSKQRPNDRTPEQKCQLVISYFSLPEEDRGKFLRENGLHTEHLTQWKKTMESSFNINTKSSELVDEKLKNKKLEKELYRKEKALAETAALLVLKKKVDSIWGTGEDE